MKVLLTGATGRVGARFVPPLRRQGAELRLMVWGPAPALPAGRPSNPGLVLGELSDRDTCRRAVEGMDAVVHIASAFQGLTPRQADEVNFVATQQLAAEALSAGVKRFIQMSSYLVYQPTPGRPAKEDSPLRNPDGAPFSAAKLGAERAVRQFLSTPLGVCVLRVAFTYGEGDPHLADAFAWARQCSQASVSGEKRLHLVHHADVRQGVLQSLQLDAAAGRIFNIADDGPLAASELAELADSGADSDVLSEFDDNQFEGAVDTAAARSCLQFQPLYPSIHDAKHAGLM